MKKKYLLIFFLCLCSFWVMAQEEVEEEMVDEEYYDEPEYNFKKSVLFGLNFQLGLPVGALKDNLDRTGWGFGGSFIGRLGSEKPIYAGLDLSFQTLDRESLVEQEIINGIVEEFRVTTKNHLMNAHFLVRYQPEVNFFIRPFVEGMLGTKVFYTRTAITDLANSSETLSSDFDRGDWAASIGGGVGFQINLKNDQLYLEGRCVYLKGTSAEYLVRDPDNTTGFLDPIEAFEPKNSVTDVIIPQIGLKFLIGWGNQNEEEEEYYEEEEY